MGFLMTFDPCFSPCSARGSVAVSKTAFTELSIGLSLSYNCSPLRFGSKQSNIIKLYKSGLKCDNAELASVYPSTINPSMRNISQNNSRLSSSSSTTRICVARSPNPIQFILYLAVITNLTIGLFAILIFLLLYEFV
jgi:hypothetical protein